MPLYSTETIIDQYLQLILQCYLNLHAVAPLVVAGTYMITGFWQAVTSWGLRPQPSKLFGLGCVMLYNKPPTLMQADY